MAPALHTFRTVVVTATLTSLAWVLAGALRHERGSVPGAVPLGAVASMPKASPTLKRPAATQPPQNLLVPVAGVRRQDLTDTFMQSRENGARLHDAIDIPAPRGTPVLAAAAGEVEKIFLSRPGGKTIYLRSTDRKLIYYYAHLDAYADGLSEGQNVAAGDVLGTVGSTGNADPAAPHLHFAIMQTEPQAKWWEPATAINPYPLLAGQ